MSFEPSPVTVLIGPNGSGKSNLLWALDLARQIAFGSLRTFVSLRGGASYLLHNGPRETDAIRLTLEFGAAEQGYAYDCRLAYGADESLVFVTERAGFRAGAYRAWSWHDLPTGGHESGLLDARVPVAQEVRRLLRKVIVYHFADTSRRSPLRTRDHARAPGEFLLPDGSNLTAVLLGLRSGDDPADAAAWRRIIGTLQRAAPFVSELLPTDSGPGQQLAWRDERGTLFGSQHLSDGTLRLVGLITALSLPERRMPSVTCIDEPELGLHPAAVEVLCGLISSASAAHQVLVATQSPALLDHFEPRDVVVVERRGGGTELRRLDSAALAGWLEDYTLSELYDKNVLGGRP